MIVGSKIDKLTAALKRDIPMAASQHVLTSSRSTEPLDQTPFLEFFNKVGFIVRLGFVYIITILLYA